MSIIIHFNAASFIPPAATLPATPSCISRARTKLAMVPGIDHTDRTVMTDDESSLVDIATSNTLYTHTVNDLKSSNHVLGSCFGLPYQDHNYGAPPPPTPPSYSPCTSPAHANGVPDEDTNLSVVSTSTINEETPEGSITRCICGFEHDDEYMICCDLCLVWQHVDCMGLNRNNIPETYLCEKCEPRKVDRHKAKVLQTRKKVAMTDSSDSEDDTVKNVERKQKTRKRKRKEEEKNDDKTEQAPGKKSKMHKHAKERIEVKRSKLKRTKNKESTSTADEEAQDAWEISLEWCEKNFEPAVNNQYTPEVQHLSKTLLTMGHEERFMELLLTRNCQIIDGNQKKLVSVYDIPRDQPLIEYKGKFLLASQFYDLHPAFSRRLFPFVIFYTLDQEELCVDASLYGNEARFVRRSCKPNSELHHLVHNGNLHLYISSTKAVFKDDEITLPLDFSLKESIKEIECACESEDCILKFHQKNGNIDISQEKRRRGRKLTFSADDDSSHSFVGINASPTKTKPPIKTQTSESMEGKSDHETEEQANERRKKTREERKIDAIMRAFDQMEKAAKRRQQALERQKAHHPKSEETSEKSENVNSSKEEDKVTTASGSETQGGEEEKSHIPTAKPKKGKRRRGSGTSGRRRTRTNSGGSDILSPEENVLLKNVLTINTDVVTNSDNVEADSVATSCSTAVSPVSSGPVSSGPVSSGPVTSPVVLKTKRFLLHEWLQEKSETNTNPSTTSPVSIRTEVKWNTSAANSTCYVQCTKDNPHSGGISAAHLRRSSTSSQIKSIPLKSCSEQGFTKKRWLRQAMYDCNTLDPLTIDPGSIEGLHLDNGYLSPPGHGEMGSPGAVDDTVTPLKKRRLMRESVESASPLSPSIQNLECSTVTALSSVNTDIKTETRFDHSDHLLLSVKADSLTCNLSSTSNEVFISMNDLNSEPAKCSKKMIIKEEANKLEVLISASVSSECEVPVDTLNSTIISSLKVEESSKQNGCDLEDETLNCVKKDCVQENNSDLLQNICVMKDSDASDADRSEACSNEKMQSIIQTHQNSSTDKSVNIDLFSSTNQCCSAEKKVAFPYDCNIQSSSCFEGNCSSSSKSDSSELKKEASLFQLDIKDITFEMGDNHPVSKIEKLLEENVHKVLSDTSSVLFANFESTKDSTADSILQYAKSHSLVSPVKDINVSLSVPLDCKIEQTDVVNLPKKVLPAVSTADSEVLGCNSFLSDININSNHMKSSELSDLDSKPSQLSCENSSLIIKTTCASATQKRKVSLSEYRMRMKDISNKRSYSENIKRCSSSPALSATAIPETLPEQVTLAPLPLFDTTVGSKSPCQLSLKSPKKKKEVKKEEESYNDITEHRENLTERLKREFGFDDDSEGPSVSNHTKSVSGSTPTLPLCAQPPPPPPPPPPRPIRSSLSSLGAATLAASSQFGFTMPTSYARPSYIVPQVPSAQFIPVQQTVNTPVMPSIHSITSPGVQCNVQPALLPSPHSFASSLPGAVLRPPIQHEYSSVNAQNFAALVQQPPPPPKTYPHVYQSGLYK